MGFEAPLNLDFVSLLSHLSGYPGPKYGPTQGPPGKPLRKSSQLSGPSSPTIEAPTACWAHFTKLTDFAIK